MRSTLNEEKPMTRLGVATTRRSRLLVQRLCMAEEKSLAEQATIESEFLFECIGYS